jgi:hypothetical protein
MPGSGRAVPTLQGNGCLGCGLVPCARGFFCIKTSCIQNYKKKHYAFLLRGKIMARLRSVFGAALAILALAGCEGFKAQTPKNFTSAINAYYTTHDDCLFQTSLRFPYEAGTSGADKDPNLKSLDALETAGLLRSLEDRDIHVKRYEQTTFGKRVPPAFCYGHRVVTSIDSTAPAPPQDGMKAVQVTYHYKMMDVPGWADSDQIRKAFPAFAKATSSDAVGHNTVVLTQVGWRVPG